MPLPSYAATRNPARIAIVRPNVHPAFARGYLAGRNGAKLSTALAFIAGLALAGAVVCFALAFAPDKPASGLCIPANASGYIIIAD